VGSRLGWPVRLGVVGCGAVVELFHLPAARCVPEIRVTGVADLVGERARQIGLRFGVGRAVTEYHELLDEADAFLLATPPDTHRAIALDLLEQGKPVLCEKPIASSLGDAEAIAEAVKRTGCLLAVGQNRRFSWNLCALRALLAGGGLGDVELVEVEDGFPFGWPARTDFFLQRASAGGGVLIENGVHVLDTLVWLRGEAVVEEYEDDALGGLESNARLRLRFAGGGEARIWVTRTAQAANRIRVTATGGQAEAPIYDTNRLTFHARHSKAGLSLGPVEIRSRRRQGYVDLMAEQLQDFAMAVMRGREPRTGVEEGARVIRLVAQAYGLKADRPCPEMAPQPGMTW
jgi:predicted dehydrogenase